MENDELFRVAKYLANTQLIGYEPRLMSQFKKYPILTDLRVGLDHPVEDPAGVWRGNVSKLALWIKL